MSGTMTRRIPLGAWYDGNAKALAELLLGNWESDYRLVCRDYFDDGGTLFIEYTARTDAATSAAAVATAVAGADVTDEEQLAKLSKAYRVAVAGGCISEIASIADPDKLKAADRDAIEAAFEALATEPAGDDEVRAKVLAAVAAILG